VYDAFTLIIIIVSRVWCGVCVSVCVVGWLALCVYVCDAIIIVSRVLSVCIVLGLQTRKIRAILADKNQEIALLQRMIDDVPVRTELIQYEVCVVYTYPLFVCVCVCV